MSLEVISFPEDPYSNKNSSAKQGKFPFQLLVQWIHKTAKII